MEAHNAPRGEIPVVFPVHPRTRARMADAGWEVHIATCAPGDCGTMTETRWAIGGRRTGEATTAAARIGATYHCLDERDGLIVYDKPTLRKAIDLFRAVAPGLVFTHAVKDYMMDHEMASLVAEIPSYLQGTNLLSIEAVTRRLAKILKLSLDLDSLRAASTEWELQVSSAVEENEDLAGNLSAAAHLIHGSSEGRFRITYAPGHLSKEEIEGVNFGYADLGETKNLAASNPELAGDLRSELDAWRKEVGAEMMCPNPDYDPSAQLPAKKKGKNRNQE